MINHSPAPWIYKDLVVSSVRPGVMHDILIGIPGTRPTAIDDANGRLVAASPDLLYALTLAETALVKGIDPALIPGTMRVIREAIEKATVNVKVSDAV